MTAYSLKSDLVYKCFIQACNSAFGFGPVIETDESTNGSASTMCVSIYIGYPRDKKLYRVCLTNRRNCNHFSVEREAIAKLLDSEKFYELPDRFRTFYNSWFQHHLACTPR